MTEPREPYVVGDGDQVLVRTGQTGQVRVEFVVEVALEPPAAPTPPSIPWVDVIASMPTNTHAPNPQDSPGRWATRKPEQIRGITVHHTGSDNYLGIAQYCTGSKGLPTTQYAYFVTRQGEILHCVPDEVAFWHDHGGYPNYHISIGIAGYWHKQRPPDALIEGLARCCAVLMQKYDLPLARVVGHRDRALAALPRPVHTECPGWYPAPVGAGWKPDFDAALAALL